MRPKDSESSQVVLAFDSTVPAADRRHLVAALDGHGLSTRRHLDFGYRSPSPDTFTVVTVAVLTMASTGFVQRFGELAADQVARVFSTVRDWLRRPRSAPAQIEIIDETTGLTFRVTAADPDAAGRMMADMMHAVSQIEQHMVPLRWNGHRWASEGERSAHVESPARSDDGGT